MTLKTSAGRLKNAKLLMTLVVMLFLAANARGAELKGETVKAWDCYVESATARMEGRLGPHHPFLWIDESPDGFAKVRNGRIVVSPAGENNPRKVPSGLIHHWIGAAFIADTTLEDVLSVVRDYDRYKEFYRPTVIDSRLLTRGAYEDRFSMVLMNKSLFLKTALDSDYKSTMFRVDGRRWYSLSQTTRTQEITEYGAPGQHTLPEEEGTGLIWRLFSITRFEERDGGVCVEIEAIALSRDIPALLRWVAEPIVRRVSRNSLVASLQQTEDAISAAARTHRRN